MRRCWLKESRGGTRFCHLLLVFRIALMGTIRVEARAAPPRQNIGGQAESAGPVHTSSNSVADRVENALAMGDLNAARRLVPEFLKGSGLTADLLLQTGINLAEHDLYAEASQVFERCAMDYPEVFDGYYNLSLAQLALQQPQVALATLVKAPRASPGDEVARTYLRGKIESALGQNGAAERDLSAAFTAAPHEENFALDLGLYYIRERKYEPAVEVFGKAIGGRQNAPYLRLGLGLAQYLGGLTPESLETLRAVLSLQPDFSPARVLLAFVLYIQGKIDEAAKLSADGFHDPNPFPYLYYIHAASLLKLQSQDYDTIENDLRLAVQLIPRCTMCYLALSKAHRRKGELEAATADLKAAVGLDPTFAEAWYNLALVYDQAGRQVDAQQARRNFERVKEIKANLETEMLRNAFLKAFTWDSSTDKQR